jgi:hypothetical protein
MKGDTLPAEAATLEEEPDDINNDKHQLGVAEIQ